MGKILAILHPVGCPDVTVTDSNSKCNDFSFDGKIIPYSDGPIDIFSLMDDAVTCFVVVDDDDDRIEADVGDMIPLPAIILSLFCLPTLLFFFSGGEYDKDVALIVEYAKNEDVDVVEEDDCCFVCLGEEEATCFHDIFGVNLCDHSPSTFLLLLLPLLLVILLPFLLVVVVVVSTMDGELKLSNKFFPFCIVAGEILDGVAIYGDCS